MQHQWLLLGVVTVSCLVACHAQFFEFLGGLALLKGAAIAGYAFGRHGGHHYGGRRHYRGYNRYRRAVGADPNEEGVLLSSVTQLDPNGCLLKLLCLAQATPEEARTPYQAALVHLFADISHAPTPVGVPFVQALQAGGSEGKPGAACYANYASCPLSGPTLHGMLVMAWDSGDQQPSTSSI